MTHMTPGRDSPVSSRTPATTGFQPSLDRSRLREAIGVRRQRLAEREADLVAACEKAVAHGAGRHIPLDDRTTWDRAAWNRYVGTASNSNPSSCRRCFASSGTSSGWNDWPHFPRHPTRPLHEHGTAERGE